MCLGLADLDEFLGAAIDEASDGASVGRGVSGIEGIADSSAVENSFIMSKKSLFL
jgi:hypothetical protein